MVAIMTAAVNPPRVTRDKFWNVPGIDVGVAVAEVVHVHAILLQAAGALLHARQEASPVAPPLPFAVEPPGHRTAVCNRFLPSVSLVTNAQTRTAEASCKAKSMSF